MNTMLVNYNYDVDYKYYYNTYTTILNMKYIHNFATFIRINF